MSTITCPSCGNEASAFGTVTNCWCDKMYCDHTSGMFASYSCTCGSRGVTPEAKQHQEHQEAKFLNEMARDVSALLMTLPSIITETFSVQSAIANYEDVQVVFTNGRSAAITVTCVYSIPKEFQVASNDQIVVAKGGRELKAALASIANA
ncbi:hypothetical protein [Pseudomonas sp. DSV-1]|uniref:hypothetical protein n=1 Tax=Pseudomonas sp. DSV-1 TaxID=3112250 RepID=UPI002DBF5DAF|nr:hypothetical protein [Pseudomonas sp. DSV-1]MEC4240598.1 hypothetical protein [Pseudomonas sp. DSV-1]